MPYYPLSGYEINGRDLFGRYKINVKKITGLEAFLARKGELSQDWPDEDGEEPFVASSDIYFEGRDIIMFCTLMTSTYDPGFVGFMKSFRGFIEASGLKTLTVPYKTATHEVMYVKGSDITMRTPKTKSQYYIGEFWLQFRETTPTRGSG